MTVCWSRGSNPVERMVHLTATSASRTRTSRRRSSVGGVDDDDDDDDDGEWRQSALGSNQSPQKRRQRKVFEESQVGFLRGSAGGCRRGGGWKLGGGCHDSGKGGGSDDGVFNDVIVGHDHSQNVEKQKGVGGFEQSLRFGQTLLPRHRPARERTSLEKQKDDRARFGAVAG